MKIKFFPLITVSCSAIIVLFLSGNGLSAFATTQQPANNRRTFADWCREKASLSPETKHTVEVLLKVAGTTDCDAASQKLSSFIELDLYKNQISDIQPLQGMTQLTSLNLSSNQISDIKPLQSLTNLGTLFLSNNQIIDIKPLQGMTNLKEVYLSGNAIASKICPLKPESICKWSNEN